MTEDRLFDLGAQHMADQDVAFLDPRRVRRRHAQHDIGVALQFAARAAQRDRCDLEPLATSNAARMFFDRPEVVMPTKTSPGRACASNWRRNKCS